jgi:tRNA G18 (ribose-2'-O)-methylase SpoU
MRLLTPAELAARQPPPDALDRLPRLPVAVVCHDVRSLHNVGQLFRLCDAARVTHLYLCGITPYPPLPQGDPRPPWVRERAERGIAKTALAALPHVPWSHAPDARALLAALRAQGYQVVALERTDASVPYDQATYRFPLALIVGHERAGVGQSLLDLADLAVELPMRGVGTSLNVTNATAVLLYWLLRLRLPGAL